MITFREWLKNKNLREDGAVPNPQNINAQLTKVLGPDNPQDAVISKSPMTLATLLRQKSQPLYNAVKQLATQDIAKQVTSKQPGTTGQGNQQPSTTILPNTMSLPIAPTGYF